MSVIVPFTRASGSKGLQRIQSTYTVREISRQFGLSESSIRRWTRKGIIPAFEETAPGGLRYDFRALTQFRRIRELRNRGLTIRQVESELHGQMNLFSRSGGRLIPLPVRRSPFEEALILHEQGDDRAVKMYQLAILQGENVSDAYCNLGTLEFENNRTAKAFDHFTNALKNDPRHFESHFNLAHLYLEAGDYRLARLHYEISAILEPNSAGVRYNLGLIYAVSGELGEAIEALNQAKEHSTGEELLQVEELLLNLKKAASENRRIENPQELLPDKQD
ncbi:MAG: tetratricopeptide repeat protein [Acidobacteria bacterium]|nr:tetratricopeptide repeat protein [Acidobacteriota bacterium]